MAVGYRGGLITGKIGGDVGYMVKNAKGRTSQGWRAYQAHVSNPNNPAQRFNRVILSTMAKAYSVLRPICDHSFEGVAGASRNQKEFAKYNIRMLQDLAPSGNGNFNPRTIFNMLSNPYIVSKGSLPVLRNNYRSAVQGMICELPSAFESDQPTYRDLFEMMGWSETGQITLLVALGDGSAEISMFKYVRFVFKIGERLQRSSDSATYDTPVFVSEGEGQSQKYYLNCTKSSEGVEYINITMQMLDEKIAGFLVTAAFFDLGMYELNGFSYISSSLVGNAWKRSTQVLELVNDGGDDNYTLEKAMASYQTVQNSSQYLNNGGRVILNG